MADNPPAGPDHPLLPHLLHIVDVKRRPGDFFAFFLRYDPTNPLTANCLRAYLRLIAARHPNVELSKQRLLRQIILRGDEVWRWRWRPTAHLCCRQHGSRCLWMEF